jgi:hypothetical protein
MLYVQLANFPKHYLVIVVTDDEFRYALISVNEVPESMYGSLVMEDIAWLDLRRIRGDGPVPTGTDPLASQLNRYVRACQARDGTPSQQLQFQP